MGLNISKGNMYDFVTHTWNTVKGECDHDCSYCYMKRWGKLKPARFDQKEMKTNLGSGNFIFVGSSCDMFANNISDAWIIDTLDHCDKFDNKYLFQTKNPERFQKFISHNAIASKSVLCTTIESNIFYPSIMNNAPTPQNRAIAMQTISQTIPTYVTIEPILDFNLQPLVDLIKKCNPQQVNIGADSGGNKLPEPDKVKVQDLIAELQKFTTIARKTNLNRII